MAGLGYTYFYVCAAIAILGALVTVTAKNPIRGAMGLMAMIVSVAGIFLALHAEFLAIIQLIVYAGAIVVLFLFVIMLLGPQATTAAGTAGTKPSRYFSAGLFLLATLGAVTLLWRTRTEIAALPKPRVALGTIEGIGRELFTTHVVPFELSGALLLVAVVGAIAVARGKQVDPTRDDAADQKAKDKGPELTAAVTGTGDGHSHAKEAG